MLITQLLCDNGKYDVTIKSFKNYCKRLQISFRFMQLRLVLRMKYDILLNQNLKIHLQQFSTFFTTPITSSLIETF